MSNISAFKRTELESRDEHERSIRRIAENVHRLNEAVQRAVDQGISVELVRVSRHHNGDGSWGDQMAPMVRQDQA